MAAQGTSNKIGARVREYRSRLGMSQADLAAALELNSAQIVSQIESGARELKARELVKAARALLTSTQNLLGDNPAEIPVACWRDKPEAGFEAVEARLCLRCERYSLLEEWTGERRTRELPRVSLPVHRVPSIADVQKAASEVRSAMQLGGRPASSLQDVLEECYGIRIFYDEFEGSGLCVSGEHGKAILLNRTQVRWRRNFSLAHELFHLLVAGIYSDAHRSDEEKHAQVFASALLLPDEAVLPLLDEKSDDRKIKLRDLVETAQEFHVSTEALLWKMVNSRRMDRDTVKGIIDSGALRTFDGRGLRKNDVPDELPDRFVRLAYSAHRRGRISIRKLAQFLETPEERLSLSSEPAGSEVQHSEEAEVAFA